MAPVVDVNDNAELQGSNDHAKRSGKDGPLYALLEKRSDLNLAGKVHDASIQCGQGGFSDVFIGYCTLANGTERKVAVKKLRAHIMEDRKFHKRLAKELYIWSKLKHPRILPLEGFYIENDSYPHLISKWMDNGTALKYLEAHPGADVISLVTGIAEAIQYLHINNIVHSDIKPDNVLISDLGEPLLCDFGVSRLLAASPTFMISTVGTGGMNGSVRYMSKHVMQATGEISAAYSKASDVWAFGMTVFTLLTGQVPYGDIPSDAGVVLAIASGKIPSWPECTRACSAERHHLRDVCNSSWNEVLCPSIDDLMTLLHDLRVRTGELSLEFTICNRGAANIPISSSRDDDCHNKSDDSGSPISDIFENSFIDNNIPRSTHLSNASSSEHPFIAAAKPDDITSLSSVSNDTFHAGTSNGILGADNSRIAVTKPADTQMCRARALYAYTQSPDDPSEISFKKGEILEILDSEGRWWAARKVDGTVGIVPSNFLQMLDDDPDAPGKTLAAWIAEVEVSSAMALYSYTASPDDPTEISFLKGEMFEILDSNGRWWQAKKKDGTVGIVPSNYLRRVSD